VRRGPRIDGQEEPARRLRIERDQTHGRGDIGANPDPRAEVHWGDQSWEEMLLAIVTMSIDPKADVTKLFEAPTRASEERAH